MVRALLAPHVAEIAAVVPSPKPLHYRVSAKLCLEEDRHFKKAVGFYKRGQKKVAHVLSCPAQDETVNKLIERIFGDLRRIPFKFYDHQGRVFQRKRLKFATIRSTPGGASGLIISHTGADLQELKRWLSKVLPANVSVYETLITPHDGDQVLGRHVRHLAGPPTFAFPLAGRTFDIAPAAFFQANYALSGALIERATAFAQDGDALLDLYSGFGAYALTVAPRFKEVVSVDGSSEAINALEKAAAAAGFSHVKGYAALCENYLASPEAAHLAPRLTHILVNPPRGGLSRVVAGAISRERFPQLKEVRYVSCNPETLARDLSVLSRQGIRATRAEPLDMFPQTEHVEVVVTLRT